MPVPHSSQRSISLTPGSGSSSGSTGEIIPTVAPEPGAGRLIHPYARPPQSGQLVGLRSAATLDSTPGMLLTGGLIAGVAATAEDVIIMKLRWFRRKDQPDLLNVMTVQRGKLDWAYIESWCRQHGSLARMEAIRKDVKDI